MLVVTGKARRNSGIGAESDFYSGIGECLQVFLGHFKAGAVLGDIGILANLVHILRIADERERSGFKSSLEERIVNPLQVIGISKENFIAHQRRNQENVAGFHGANEFCINRLIANAVGESVHARGEQRFSVHQIKFVSKDANLVFVRFIDDRAINFWLHLGAMAQPIVHPHLDVVGMIHGQFSDVGARFVWCLRAIAVVGGVGLARFEEASARGVKACASDFSSALVGSYGKD